MKAKTYIMEPKIIDIEERDLEGLWVNIGDNIKLNFDDRETAMSFAEIMRDKLLEGGEDGN
jgi:formylmethanofuran dehydrogenase subunit D